VREPFATAITASEHGFVVHLDRLGRPTEVLGSFSISSAFASTLEWYSANSSEEKRSGERP